ncbi:MAG TPA: ABC transporter ATP-binding protein [Candidatus Saccharimonadales bacterium]|nr:ABC transporter ATP-binding protein [Candidatus Saccharimonadales bacterium]
MSDEIAIKVENVSKTFRLPHEKNNSIKGAVLNFYKQKRTYEKQKALTDISFEVKKGEFFGIVGRNGSGKSTLLKMLAGIYSPSRGSIQVNGKLTPFIELGVGFNPELTGRENVFLNGALLGFNRKEMQAMYHDIVEFAELERFMDQKLKNYSSGMQVRLAFSIAIRANTDILLLDEVLAVGDERFQDKCIGVFEDLKNTDKTIILVSHDMNSLKRFCSRAAVIHDSKLEFIGDTLKATNKYVELNFPEAFLHSHVDGSDHKAITVKLGDGKFEKKIFLSGEKAVFDIKWTSNQQAKNIGIALFTESGQYVYGTNTIIDKTAVSDSAIRYSVDLKLGSGDYYAQIGVFGENDSQKIYFAERAASFKVTNQELWQGVTKLKHTWTV